MADPSPRCPACGTPARGRFCPNCGAALTPPPAAGRAPTSWLAVGGALVLALVFALGLLVGRGRGAAAAPAPAEGEAPFAAGGGSGPAPDISNLTPRERFDRLYDRVMRAASSGDMTTVENFAPMAIQAYGMLDSVDADAQFDAATLMLHVGQVDAARALADSMTRARPAHLFGWMLKATVARFSGDSAGERAARAQFDRHYEEEMKAARPEYTAHRTAIDNFRRPAPASP
ncbi:MAG TPA: hypothetical protein VFS07_02880 [Gemmatimonadales bacterium]|nr:hypothetical protein [Gemmatimonadales bacterium]